MTRSVLMPAPQPVSQRKKHGLLGDAVTIAGTVAGGIVGGPGGALTGASLGTMVGDRFGANDMVSEGGGAAPTGVESNAMQRRLDMKQKDPITTLQEAQAALAYRPPEEQKEYGPALEQALALARRDTRRTV